MITTYRSKIEFNRLVDDCWGILKGERSPFYTGTGRGGPAPVVFVNPTNFDVGWYWEFWEGVVAPSLIALSSLGGPDRDWGGSGARSLVAAYLRTALEKSSWSGKVLY